ncbi:MAG: hypothetical protein WCG27_08545, partial [Pseudomonadota bacterium]
KNRIELFSIDEVQARIPVWSILTGGGSVDIQLDKPLFRYHEFKGEGNNWTYAMGDKKATAQATPQETKEVKKEEKGSGTAIAIPAFLSRTRLNFRLTSMRVAYELKDGQKGEVQLSRFLIKNLNFETSTAFELASQMDFKLPEKKSLGLEALVIGDINFSELVKGEKFTVQTVVTLKNFKTVGFPINVPDIKTEIKALIDKKGAVIGDLNTSFNGRNKMATKFQVAPTKVVLSDIDVALFIQDLLDMASIQNEMLRPDKALLTLSGGVTVDMVTGQPMPNINPELKFALDPGINFAVKEIKGTSKMVGAFKGGNVEISMTNAMLEGTANVLVKMALDLRKGQFNPQKLPPFDVDVRLSNMKLSREVLQKTLYPPKAKVEPTATAAESAAVVPAEKKVASAPPPLPPGKITLNFSGIKMDKEELSGNGEIIIANSSVATKFLNFKYSDGKGVVTHVTNLSKDAIRNKFDFKLNGLNLMGLSPFLPPQMEGLEGTFSGTVGGTVELLSAGPLKYDVIADVNAANGNIKGLKMGDMLSGLTTSLPFLKGQADKKLDFDSAFETLSLKGEFKDTVYELRSFNFVGVKKKVQMVGAGQIYPPPSTQSGAVTLDLTDNTGAISGPLEKYSGSKVLPLKMVGPGFALKPDYGYTTGKLAKGALKSTATKQAVKQVGEKLIKDEKVQKLLKGFFK